MYCGGSLTRSIFDSPTGVKSWKSGTGGQFTAERMNLKGQFLSLRVFHRIKSNF